MAVSAFTVVLPAAIRQYDFNAGCWHGVGAAQVRRMFRRIPKLRIAFEQGENHEFYLLLAFTERTFRITARIQAFFHKSPQKKIK
jgi:hypothetical protein